MQVTKDKARVERSVVLPVLAYLLLLRLYGRRAASRQEVSLFALKQRFRTDVWHEQWQRSEQRWGKKFEQLKLGA